MAEFGIKATGLPQPNTPAYIKPGVVDQSQGMMANTIAGLIPGAVTAYEGLQQRDLRLKQNENVADLEASIEADKTEKDASAGIVETTALIGNIWGPAQTDTGLSAGVLVANKERERQTALLTQARATGRITDAEFLARNTKLVREAVTKNPWMEAELYKQANTHLAALGITGLLDAREKGSAAAAKAERDDYEYLMGRAKSYDLKWYSGMPKAELEASVNKKAGELELSSNIQRALESGKRITQLEARNSIESGSLDRGISAVTNSYNDSFISELKANPKEYANIVTNNEMRTQQLIQQTRNAYGLAAVEEGPVKDRIDQMEKDFITFNKIMREAGSGELALTQAKNSRDFTLAVQEGEFAGKHNKFAMEHAKNVAQILQLTESQMSTAGYKKTVTSLLKFAGSNNLLGIDERDNTIKSGAGVNLLQQIGSKVDSFSNSTIQLTTSMVLNETNKFIERNPAEFDTGYTALKSSLGTIAQKQDEIRGSSVNPEMMKSVDRAVQVVMGKHLPDMMKGIRRMEASPANAGKKVVLDVVMGGLFVLKTGDPKSDEVVNKLYAADVNNALDSFAAVRGQTREKASLEFYTTYYSSMVGDSDLTGPDSKGAYPNTPEEITKMLTPLDPPAVKPKVEKKVTTKPPREDFQAKGKLPLNNESEIRQAFDEGFITADQFKSNMERVRKGK